VRDRDRVEEGEEVGAGFHAGLLAGARHSRNWTQPSARR
jgi:hypothetical protein